MKESKDRWSVTVTESSGRLSDIEGLGVQVVPSNGNPRKHKKQKLDQNNIMEELSIEETTRLRGGFHMFHLSRPVNGNFSKRFGAGNGIANNSGGIGNNGGPISNSFNTITVIPQGGEIDFES